MADRIDELSGPYNGDLWYAEGFAQKVDEAEGHGPWFCFEASWGEITRILQGLGFAREQIEAAKEAPHREIEAPHGEQQREVDWLESRFDGPEPYEPSPYDGTYSEE